MIENNIIEIEEMLLKNESWWDRVNILRKWAESIMQETATYNWTETTWEEKNEQFREIKRQLG